MKQYYAYVASSPFNGERGDLETLNYDSLLQRMIPRDKGNICLNFVFSKLRKCDKSRHIGASQTN